MKYPFHQPNRPPLLGRAGKNEPVTLKVVLFLFIVLILTLVLIHGCSNKPVTTETQERDLLTVALTGKYPPFSFYDNEGNLVGFDVDVSKAVAEYLGSDVKIIATEWDGIVAGLLADKYDAIIGSMAITQEREKAVNFSTPYYTSGAQLFIHEDEIEDISGIKNCEGKNIGVVLGETYEHYLRNNHPEVNVVTFKGTPDIFQDVENRRLAGFVTDRLVGSWQIRNAEKPFTPVGDLLYEERIAIPVNKENPELLAAINSALKKMDESGELNRLNDKWFGLKHEAREMGMASTVIIAKLAKGFGITLVIAAISLAIGFMFAIPCGVLLNRGSGLAYIITRSFVDFFRGTPVLIQLFFVYFGAPQIGITLSPIASAVITLSINSMAYMAEVVRAGLMSVDKGQTLAGRAMGFSKSQVFRFIIWPQAFRIAIPPLMNSVVALTKDTALVSIISVSEVIREAQTIISVTFDPIRYYFIVAIMFFVVTFPLMKLADRLEKKIKQRGFAG